MAKSPRMTIDDVLNDMRANGMSIGKTSLCHCLREGVFPFANVIGVGPTGRTDFLIMRKDYEAWAEEYLYAYASA